MKRFVFSLLLAVWMPIAACATVHIENPIANEQQSGFIKISVSFDTGDLLFITLDGKIVSGYVCSVSTCEFYLNSMGIENGQHMLGAAAYDKASMEELESSEISITVFNDEPPALTEQITGPALILVPAKDEFDVSETVKIWMLYFPDIDNNPLETYDIKFTLYADAGIELADDCPPDFKSRVTIPAWTLLEISKVNEGQQELRIEGIGNEVMNTEGQKVAPDITLTTSIVFKVENNKITVE